MNFQAFYRSYTTDTNVSVDDIPLLVNCVGIYHMDREFCYEDIRNDWYLQIIKTGKLLCDGHKEISQSQFIIRSPHTKYKYELNSGEMSYYCLHFTGYRVKELLEMTGICAGRIYTVSKHVLGEIDKEFSKLINEFKYKRDFFEEASSAMLSTILIVLGRAVKNYERSIGTRERQAHLDLSIAIIHQHFAGNLRVGELANLEHMSESRYRKSFGEIYGCSPGEYISRLRLSRACELLSGTDIAVGEIARICGYADALYFSRIFSKKKGSSPREYRNQSKKNIDIE